jgi:transketolase
MTTIEQQSIDTLRFLSVDMVETARSGHPGLPLGAAPMAYALWARHLRHDPKHPKWPDRDRFVLSAGHGSALLYALLHLSGYDLSLEELRRFRQWGSRTPGHPEAELTSGVEVTTGPLGQGFGMGVGLAIAERFLADRYNRPGYPVVDHRTFGLVSDGDLMEGISAEAASLAGTLGLGRLIYLYDSNDISLEGETRLAFTEEVGRRFESYGWSYDRVEDGNDLAAISAAIARATAASERPHLIEVRTHIGFGSPKQDSKDAHGAPLGTEGARSTKAKLGWPLEPSFHVPEEVRRHFAEMAARGAEQERAWRELLDGYRREHAALADEFEAALAGRRPFGWERQLPRFAGGGPELATREASAKVLNALARQIPTLVGGSADLAPSTNTLLEGGGSFLGGRSGRNLHFGVREHAMGAAINGMAMHGGVLPYGATFLAFADYQRPALRLAALMRAHALYLFTHDSVALGEDGPTHQPIEHLWSLRAIPGLTLLRPADANETVVAYRVAVEREGPVVLVFTRQKLPVLDPERYPIESGVPRGGYILEDAAGGSPRIVLVATGSEVALALAAHRALSEAGIAARVVSMPSVELFREQAPVYREHVLPPGTPTLAIEAGSGLGWWQLVGPRGDVIGLDRFGASAPGPVVLRELGFTVENVVDRARRLLAASA